MTLIAHYPPRAAAAARPQPARPNRAARQPRRLVNLFGGLAVLVAVTILIVQLRNADLESVFAHVRIGFLAAAVGFIALSLVAAAYNLLGFSPLKLKLIPTIGAQLAVSGLRMIAPSAVSTPAVAGRYLTRCGASTSDAVATVAVAQSAQLLVTTVMVAGLGMLSGAGSDAHINGPRTALIAATAAAALWLAGWVACRVSTRVRAGLISARRSALTLLRHAKANPGTVAIGLGGSAALTATHVLAFACCVAAVGGHASFLSLTMIYLAAASAGSLIPTPGGVGAVEAALIAGLSATGISLPVAAAASLLSRLISVWLPAIPGWLALAGMRRRGLL